jgi:hypothetical protein
MRLIKIIAAFVVVTAEAVQDARGWKLAIYRVDDLKRPVDGKIHTVHQAKDLVEIGRIIGRKGRRPVAAYKQHSGNDNEGASYSKSIRALTGHKKNKRKRRAVQYDKVGIISLLWKNRWESRTRY